MRKLKLKLVAFLLGLLLTQGAYMVFLYYNLDVGEIAHEADVIIVNEGVYQERAQKGAELLHEGYADQILVSPALDYSLEWYYDLGVSDEQIIREDEATSTWTNATNSLAIMEENNWISALVVSSDYHLRRVKLSYERAKRALDYDVDLTYISAYPVEDGRLITYREDEVHRGFARGEVFKYMGYLLSLYRFIDL